MNAPMARPLWGDVGAWRRGGALAAHRTAALTRAVDTMMRGTAFVHGRAAILEQRGASSVARHAMVLANALRELDCFLLVLLDELAASAGMTGQSLRSFRRRRNAAGKLSAYPALFGSHADDHRLLLALSGQKKILLALFQGRRPIAGERPVEAILPAVDLKTISSFYADLSRRIIGHADNMDDTRRAIG